MKFNPKNRHILIEPELEKKNKEENVGFLLPEDYQERPKPYAVAKVLDIAPSCKIDLNKGDRVLVENSMVQKIDVDGDEVYLLLENYVFGVVSSK